MGKYRVIIKPTAEKDLSKHKKAGSISSIKKILKILAELQEHPMRWMFLRVCDTSPSTAVPQIGKKRIRCSGGGNTVMSLIRSSSVLLVFSTLRYQESLAWGVWAVMGASSRGVIDELKKRTKKPVWEKQKTAGLCSVGGWLEGVQVLARCGLSSARD